VLKTALLDLGKTHPDLRDAVFTSPLVETDEATHLAPVVEALEIVTPP
jgi:hypothetical protein